jgi:hypothetical protein
VIVTAVLVAMLTTTESDRVAIWYFAPSGVPVAAMGAEPPTFAGIPDPDGDGEVGRTLRPGDHQEFLASAHQLHVQGSPWVDIWLRSPDPTGLDVGGRLSIRLLECRAEGCSPLSGTMLDVERWSTDRVWGSYSITLPEIDVELAAGSQLCVRFDPDAETSVALAYGSTTTPAALLLPLASAGDEQTPEDTEGSTPETTTTTTATAMPTPDDRSDLIRPSMRGFGLAGTGVVGPGIDARVGAIAVLLLVGSTLIVGLLVRRR